MSIYKRKDRPSKPWIFEYQVQENGKTTKHKKGFSTRSEAKRAEAEFLVENSGFIRMDTEITFVDYFDIWLQTYKQSSVSANTLTKYITSQNTIAEYFK